MNKKEYTDLLKYWNNFLIEENSTIQTQLLIESIILNEGLIELSKKFGKKIALGMLILKMFDLNPNIEKPDIDNPISFKAPGIERIINQAKETFENHSNEKVDNIDPVKAVKAAEANNKLQSINEEDFNNSFKITRALLSVFGESFEEELEKSDISLMKGIYSKNVYDSWINSRYKDNKILQSITETLKGENGQDYKTVTLEGNVNVVIYAFKDKDDLYKKITKYIREQIIIPSIKIKNNIISKELFNDIKKSYEITTVINNEIQEWLSLSNVEVNGSYWDYSNLQKTIYRNIIDKHKDLELKIELNNIKGGVIGVRVDNRSDSEINNTLVHEFGHALDQLESHYFASNFIRFLKKNNVENPKFSTKKVKLRKKLFINFILSEIKQDFNISSPWVWESFNSLGKKKLINNVKHLIRYLKGSNIIRTNKDGTIDLIINVYDKKAVYYHILEERVENLGNWSRTIIKYAKNHGIENAESIPLSVLKQVNSKLKANYEKDFKEETKRLTKKYGKKWWLKNKEKLEYSIKSDILSSLDIEQIFMSVCNDLKFSMSSIAELSFDFISIDTLTTDENVIDDIENLINIIEETSKNLHNHKNHSH